MFCLSNNNKELTGLSLMSKKNFFTERKGYVIILLAFLFIIIFLNRGAWGDVSINIVVTNPTPNPFDPYSQTTSLTYTLDTSQYVAAYIVNRFHDLGRQTFTNPYGGSDAVNYYEEVVKTFYTNKWVVSGQTQTLTWDGSADNTKKVQKGTYYFKIVPKSYPQYTKFVEIKVTKPSWLETWRAYIRQARTWDGITPYTWGGVSRQQGRGSDCSGFVITCLREFGSNYDFPYLRADVYSLYNIVSGANHPVGRVLTTKRGRYDPSTNPVKQSNCFAWCLDSSFDHTSMFTYESNGTKYHIHSSSSYGGVFEKPIYSWYWTKDPNPYMFYFNAIGSGG